MKFAFLTGFLLGVAAILVAAFYYPWVDVARIPSRTTVVANGGRAEQFLIRLPADKVSVSSNLESGPRLQQFPASVALPEDLSEQLVLIEHFKIRDSSGDVIGVAARHTVEADQRIEAAWNLVIPGRGAMLLRGDAVASMLDRRLADEDYRPDEPWAGNLRIPAAETEPGMVGELIAGTGEFDQLNGRYAEFWQISGVSKDGSLRGTIQLNTVSSSIQ